MDAKASASSVAVGLGTESRSNAVAVGRGAQAWDNAIAIGSATWATEDHSVAIGKSAKTEEPNQVMFGATPDHQYGDPPLNLKTYGTMQATDFLDADGNSIIGGGGEEEAFFGSLKVSLDYNTGDWGEESYNSLGGAVLTGGGGSGVHGAYTRLSTYNFDYTTIGCGTFNMLSTLTGRKHHPNVYGNSVWAVFEHHNPQPLTSTSEYGAAGTQARERVLAPRGADAFWEGRFEDVLNAYLDKDGNAMMSILMLSTASQQYKRE